MTAPVSPHLDTDELLRLIIDSGDISESFKQQVEAGLADSSVAVSTITFVETARRHLSGRIDLGCHPAVRRRERLRSGLLEIQIGGDIAVESVLLMNTGFHRDPTDQPDRRYRHAGRDATRDNRREDHRLGVTNQAAPAG